jgi:CheY-like chemotaxis protein
MKKILWIEDNLYDAALILAALEESNQAQSIQMAIDGREIMDYRFHWGQFEGFPNGNPEVIILDLKMPGMDGKEVLTRIKRDNTLRNIPVIIFTSSDEERDVRECFDLGADGYVVKPIGFQDFSQTVKGLSRTWPNYLGSRPLMLEGFSNNNPLFKSLPAS